MKMLVYTVKTGFVISFLGQEILSGRSGALGFIRSCKVICCCLDHYKKAFKRQGSLQSKKYGYLGSLDR